MKKLVALVLSLCMLMGLLPAMAETVPAGDSESNAIVITRDDLFETARAFVKAGEDTKAFALFEFLADRGDAQSQNNLGWMYDEGRGVEKSVEKANQYYKMAADQGLDKAQYNLALNYDFVLKDYQKAMEYYQLAAAQGHAKAINNIGDMYENARGVEQDYAKAMAYYQDSLDKGYDYALTSIGYMYENGLGVEPDLEKAVEYYSLAAEKGVENGVNHLNRLIEEGKIVKEYRVVTEAPARTTKIEAHFASVEEGQQLMRNRTLYHEQINEKNLEFMLQKKGGTLEEFIDFAAEQVQSFEQEEEKKINDLLAWMQAQLDKHGLALPDPGTITFVKTSGEEAAGAAAYTSEGAIFLSSSTPSGFMACTEEQEQELLAHEIFHCLSRLFPEFKKAMYSLIHFNVLDQDIDIPQEVWNEIMANPDVEHHNSTATFTINGEKKECYLIFGTDSAFEKPGDDFFEGAYIGIVPIGESIIYRVDNVEDFWDVVGQNAKYAEDPEEIMATIFGKMIMRLDDGMENFQTPEIPEGIISYLKNGDT